MHEPTNAYEKIARILLSAGLSLVGNHTREGDNYYYHVKNL